MLESLGNWCVADASSRLGARAPLLRRHAAGLHELKSEGSSMVQPVSGYCATTTQRCGRIAGLHFHLEIRETVCESRSGAMIDGAPAFAIFGTLGFCKHGSTQRLHSSSFLGLPYRILNI